MLKDEAGPADPLGVFWSGARAGGNNGFTRGGSFPLGLLENADEGPNIVDSSLVENESRAPAAILRKHRIETRKISRFFSVGLPTSQTARHLVV